MAMVSRYKNFSVEPSSLVFQGDHKRPITQRFRITNLTHEPRLMGLGVKRGARHIPKGLHNYFLVHAPSGQANGPFVTGIQVPPSQSVTIQLTLKPSQVGSVDELPTWLEIFRNEAGRDFLELQIEYAIDDATMNAIAGQGKCNQCMKPGVYICQQCDPPYELCLGCAERGGREAHISYHGEEHTPEYQEGSLKCCVCQQSITGVMTQCIDCARRNPFASSFCRKCAGNHQNLQNHTRGANDAHFFCKTAAHPLDLGEPKQYKYGRGKEVRCTMCKGRVRKDHEFFRCVECPSNVIMCDGCADKGGIAKHFFHRFELYIARSATGTMSRTNTTNPNDDPSNAANTPSASNAGDESNPYQNDFNHLDGSNAINSDANRSTDNVANRPGFNSTPTGLPNSPAASSSAHDRPGVSSRGTSRMNSSTGSIRGEDRNGSHRADDEEEESGRRNGNTNTHPNATTNAPTTQSAGTSTNANFGSRRARMGNRQGSSYQGAGSAPYANFNRTASGVGNGNGSGSTGAHGTGNTSANGNKSASRRTYGVHDADEDEDEEEETTRHNEAS